MYFLVFINGNIELMKFRRELMFLEFWVWVENIRIDSFDLAAYEI